MLQAVPEITQGALVYTDITLTVLVDDMHQLNETKDLISSSKLVTVLRYLEFRCHLEYCQLCFCNQHELEHAASTNKRQNFKALVKRDLSQMVRQEWNS